MDPSRSEPVPHQMSREGQAAWLGSSRPWGHGQHSARDERCQPSPPSLERTHIHHADGVAHTLSDLTPPVDASEVLRAQQ